ncbi:patatin-like phospholipase family protein [uncultured Sphaerochaeta sp.]|uniref:patatin-like phospholipase family protein n=1 Tax=uncultured Sphaerochaeta sp. TaxID=886478 RepID=UPI002A0A5086|nr:patatin-like phospholipase family protein [uncultured Sphaerochaeta sp.]
MKRIRLMLCLFIMVALGGNVLLAETIDIPEITNATTDILSADIPIQYGDAQFRQRILERTKGLRSPIGLVLSGGSARAFAHIGVLKYLEEQGIVPDFIVSNSMGSIVGLMYAAGMTPDQILNAITSVSLQSLFDFTLPLKGGLLDSSRFVAKLASFLGPDLKLEDLKIPIIVVSEDLVTKRQVQISEGNFYTAMTAAYALPVYFPPVEFNGHLLVDGGISNIVPLDIAYNYADSVIVSTTFYNVDTLNLRNPLTALNVAFDIGKRRVGVEELKKHLSDVVWIRCGVENVSFMDFSAVKQLSEKGYASAALQKDALQGLYKTVRQADYTSEVTQMDQNIKNAQDSYRFYSHIKQYFPYQILGIGVDSNFASEDTSFLKDDTIMGLKYSLRAGDFSLTSIAGMALQSSSNSQSSVGPTLQVNAEYYLFDHFKASLVGSTVYDSTSQSFSLYGSEHLEGRFLFLDDQMRLSVLQGFEMLSNPNSAIVAGPWSDNVFLFNAGVEGLYVLPENPGWNVSKIKVGTNYKILGDFSSFRPFMDTGVDLGFEQTLSGIFINFSTSVRLALDGNGNVPFFLSDTFRTNNSAILSQGHDLTVSTNATNYLVATACTVGIRPTSFLPSFAELVILENSSLATYFNFLWYEKNMGWLPAMSMGLELHTDISLLGIRKLPITLYGGWDQSVDSIVWGFLFNMTY